MPARLRKLDPAALAAATDAADTRALVKHYLAVLEQRLAAYDYEVRS